MSDSILEDIPVVCACIATDIGHRGSLSASLLSIVRPVLRIDYLLHAIFCINADEALVLESKVLALRSPDSRTLAAFKKWFSVVVPVLWGRDRMLFDDTNDLAALAPLAETDRLNLLLQRYCGWMFRQGEKTPYDKKDETTEDLARIRERARTAGLFYYPHHSVQVAGAIISTIFSAVLLVGAIVSLLATSGSSSNGLRVAIVVIFTCVFALVVGLLTNARRAEIFGATAA